MGKPQPLHRIDAYGFSLYMGITKFRGKPIVLVLYIKKMSRVNPYFSTKFCLSYLAHAKSQFFVKQLGSCIDSKDVHATYLLEFFNNLKYV
jgi:hypothetical protein